MLNPSSQFIKFVLTGGLAAVVNYASRFGWNLMMPFPAAVVVAYGCGMMTAFVLNKLFVFEGSARSVYHQFYRFTIVNVLAVAQTLIISLLLKEWLLPSWGVTQYTAEIAHGIGVMVPIVTSYLGHKNYTFSS